jgi:hypothetical protein
MLAVGRHDVRTVHPTTPPTTLEHPMTSTIATAWPTNTATPAPGWDRLTDTDGTQPSGWFTPSTGAFRAVVKGYPTWDDAP